MSTRRPRFEFGTPALRARGVIETLVLTVSAAVVLSGCERPLLMPDEERSPYHHYDEIRSQNAPPYVEDEFGHLRPNLRARLGPKQ